MNETSTPARAARAPVDAQSFLLRRVQPALSGLMDGSLRHKYFHTSFSRSFLAITVGGAIIAALSAALGLAAAG